MYDKYWYSLYYYYLHVKGSLYKPLNSLFKEVADRKDISLLSSTRKVLLTVEEQCNLHLSFLRNYSNKLFTHENTFFVPIQYSIPERKRKKDVCRQKNNYNSTWDVTFDQSHLHNSQCLQELSYNPDRRPTGCRKINGYNSRFRTVIWFLFKNVFLDINNKPGKTSQTVFLLLDGTDEDLVMHQKAFFRQIFHHQ